MLSRRTALFAPLAVAASGAGATGKMTLCMHQGTSRAAGYRKSLEGWAKAGIRNVELTQASLDDFLKTDSLTAAGRVFRDLGLSAVSSQTVVADLWIPGPERTASLDSWKKRCEQMSSLGLTKIYCPSQTTRKVTADDYKATPGCIREAGEIAGQYNLTAMIEFTRTSTHLATLTSSLQVIREAALANVETAARIARGRIQIKGNGGIRSASDVLSMLRAGACCVDLYSAFIYEGWTVARDIHRELLQVLGQSSVASLAASTLPAYTFGAPSLTATR